MNNKRPDGTTCPEVCTSDMQRTPLMRRHGVNNPNASPSLAAYRGEQLGIHNAYIVIKDKYPRVAKYLLKHFNMDEDGNITL